MNVDTTNTMIVFVFVFTKFRRCNAPKIPDFFLKLSILSDLHVKITHFPSKNCNSLDYLRFQIYFIFQKFKRKVDFFSRNVSACHDLFSHSLNVSSLRIIRFCQHKYQAKLTKCLNHCNELPVGFF